MAAGQPTRHMLVFLATDGAHETIRSTMLFPLMRQPARLARRRSLVHVCRSLTAVIATVQLSTDRAVSLLQVFEECAE